MSLPDFGYGQLLPSDYASEYNKIAFLVRQMIAKMNTHKLVQVNAVHANSNGPLVSGTVDVTPLVMQVDGIGNTQAHSIVPGIPWFRLQSGSNGIICDPQVNDIGWVDVCDRDTSKVRTTFQQAPPGSGRQYNLADGIYVGGISNVALTQYIQFLDDGIKIVDKNNNTITTSGTGITIMDTNGNQIQMMTGAVNIITPVFQVNGVPVIVP